VFKLITEKHLRFLGFLLIAIALLTTAFGNVTRISAQDRSLHWNNWTVDISNIDTTNNVFHVVETQQIAIETGPFNGADRHIPLGRVTSIDNVHVFDGEKELQQYDLGPDSCGTGLGIVCVSTDYSTNEQVMYWNFTSQAKNGTTRTMKITYDVHGALRSYKGGDQLYWKAFSDNRPFPLYNGSVNITLPNGLTPQIIGSNPNTWKLDQSKPQQLIFSAPGNLGTSDNVEVRVQYPHNPAMAAPPWQAAYDQAVAIGPIISLGLVALAGLILVGGTLFVIFKYTSHKRGLPPIVVPEYLTEPPSDDPPAIAATLVENRAETKFVIATLLDLARRGLIVIEQETNGASFIFHRTDKTEQEAGVRPFETLMLSRLFPGNTQVRSLSQLTNTFYKTVEEIEGQLNKALVSEGYCKHSPDAVRGGWYVAGGTLAVLGGGAIYLFFKAATRPEMWALLPLPLGAMVIIGVLFFLAANFMPSRTAKGEQEAAKWRAFRTYLANIRKYADLKQATDQFDKYIGYATAFGLDKHWVHEFSPVLTTMPTWYYPTYIYGPYGGRYPGYGYGYGNLGNLSGSAGRPGMMPNISGSGGGIGGLNEASNNLTQGLNAMNSGLTNLLNSAATTMTSRPQSSSSSGGGWSGGGGGGGSSGGGSSGFH
jgi:type II secretory pathway pseudopilin PulG